MFGKAIGIGSDSMKILLRHFKDEYFYVKKVILDKHGTAIYNLSFPERNKIINVYIEYDHNDKDLYGKVIMKTI